MVNLKLPLQGKTIERTVFVHPPKEANTNKICKLQKCIYGLADASRYWCQAFNYIGIYLKQNNFSITINQIDYMNSINEIKVNDTLKRNKNDKLTQKEITSLRGALGKINWVVGMSRPEIRYHVCDSSTRVKNPTIVDIFTINKVIKFIKSTPSHITIPVMNLESLQLLLYSGASFNNLPEGGSQGGYIVFLCNKFSVPIAWNLTRLKRMTRSTLNIKT